MYKLFTKRLLDRKEESKGLSDNQEMQHNSTTELDSKSGSSNIFVRNKREQVKA